VIYKGGERRQAMLLIEFLNKYVLVNEDEDSAIPKDNMNGEEGESK